METLQVEFASLTPKQMRCLPMLAVGLSASEISKKAKVSQVQISEWKKDSNFMVALDTTRKNALKDAEMALGGLAMEAVLILRESMNNASSEQTRLRAAMYIVDKLGFTSVMDSKGEIPSGTVNMNLLLTALGTQKSNSND